MRDGRWDSKDPDDTGLVVRRMFGTPIEEIRAYRWAVTAWRFGIRV
ncbi:hypothetical protein [Actinomadura sediminis]|uniref:Uncharacterized protein n=1 Tax=Actinomadura sediminis TaxID=1038904 RepID=A0ABW3EME8_9ACTN